LKVIPNKFLGIISLMVMVFLPLIV
jgi:hypothetical protein